MKTPRVFALGALAGLLLSGIASAADAPNPSESTTDKVVYEGTDTQGRIVHLTIPNLGIATLVQVAPVTQHYPRLHWTASIGSGGAGELEH
jgi:hypothetical protein